MLNKNIFLHHLHKDFDLDHFIRQALKEDIGNGDHTSISTIPSNAKNKANLIVKENGIIAGIELAKKIFHVVDKNLKVTTNKKDGSQIKKGDIAFTVEGNARSILTAERLVLNCMQRMSGIATMTNKLIQLCKPYKIKLLDTRKTTPLVRGLEKWAVKIGGGHNHRFGLYDMILIKNNHIDFAGGIQNAIESANEYLKMKKLKFQIEIEARNLKEVNEILAIGKIDRILLDNFSTSEITKAVQLINGRFETEISGGVNEKNIRKYASCGTDYISVGALTHSVKSLDMSLTAVPT
jgi:nicotinate-nucleotide pyrophosphorylase (carboxylating)